MKDQVVGLSPHRGHAEKVGALLVADVDEVLHDAQGLAVGALEAVDGGIGTDPGGVEIAREQRFDHRGPRVEGAGFQHDRGTERRPDRPRFQPPQRGRMGDVRQVPEPEDAPPVGGTGIARTARGRERCSGE